METITSAAQDAQDAGDDEKELEEMKKRVQEMEEEARKLKEMQEQVESLNAGSTINKEEADARSVYVGNVRNWPVYCVKTGLPFS
jgi:polyadenylate-binding protein 2